MTRSRFLAVACVACPFRTDEVLALPAGRRAEIAGSIHRGDPFHCHKTIEYTEDGPDVSAADLCGGARQVAAHDGIVSDLEQVAGRLGMAIAPAAGGPEVYPSLTAWVEAGRR